MKFVGREDAMTTLHQQLQQSERVAISAVSGMGGIGKTELALQYAHHYKKERYPGGVCWLRARDENVGVQLVTYAKVQMELNPPDDFEPEKKLEQQVAYCWRNWDQELGDVLVILDDVVNYEEVADYLPPVDPRFKVLITTRQQWLGESFQRLELQVLDEPAALELLVSLVGESRIEAEAETAKALCEDLGRLPLGLELVGRYLKRKPDLSLETMRQRLGLEHRSLEKTKTSSEMTAKRGVKAAFELSWQELDADARILAGLLSLFAPAPISWSLVESCLSAKPKIVRTGCFSFPVFSSIVKRLQNLFKTRRNDEAENQETLSVSKIEDIRDEVLVNFSLLQRNEDGTYQLHPLIREFLRGKLEQDRICKVGKILPTLPEDLKLEEILKRSICQVMVAEAKEIPKTPTRENILEIAPAIPHIAEVAEKLTNWLTDDDLITPFTALDRFYAGQGFYSQAQPWCNQCLSVSQTRLGENHPLVATFLNNLANLYQSQGRYEEAEPLYLQALEMYKRILGENHPNVATSLNNLAMLYNSQGRYQEAEPLLVQALEMKKRIFGENHPDVAQSLNNLAMLYKSQGRYEEAEPFYLQALEMYKRILGENHPDVATSLNNLGLLYYSQGQYEQAEPLYLQALEMKKRILGENHPDVATLLNNLALLYDFQGRYEEAEPLYLQALEMRKLILGENHPDVATSLENLAGFLAATERPKEALKYFQAATEVEDRIMDRVFAASSETDRLRYLDQIRTTLEVLLSLVWQDLRDCPAAVQMALDVLLKRKALSASAQAAFNYALLSDRYPELAPDFETWRQLNQEILHLTYSPPGMNPNSQLTLEQWKEQLDRKQTEADGLAKSLSAQVPEIKLQAQLQTANRCAIATELPQGAVLLEFVRFRVADFQESRWQSARYVAFVLPAGQENAVQMVDLGTADEIDQLINGFRQAAEDETSDVWLGLIHQDRADRAEETGMKPMKRSFAQQLSEILCPPLLDAVGDSRHWYIAPDGNFNLLPLQLLPLPDRESDRGLLMDQYNISYLSVGRDLLRDRVQPLRPAAAPLIFADPDFDLHDGCTHSTGQVGKRLPTLQTTETNLALSLLDTLAGSKFLPAPGTGFLGETVAKQLKVRPFLQKDAREPYLATADCPSILLIATHGYFQEAQKPYFELIGLLLQALLESDAEKILAENSHLVNDDFLAILEILTEQLPTAFSKKTQQLRDLAEKINQNPPQPNGVPKGQQMGQMMMPMTPMTGDRFSATEVENSMMRSGLALAGANLWLSGQDLPTEYGKGFLFAYDIANLDLWANELTVLSACETGIGDVKQGEGVFGMRRAFAVAGCKTLVMSLWSVPDKVTALLMSRFFENLRTGVSRYDALKDAQNYIRTLTIDDLPDNQLGDDIKLAYHQNLADMATPFAHPFYWGAWVLQGATEPMDLSVFN